MIPIQIATDAEQVSIGLDHSRMVGQGVLTGIGLLRHGTVEGNATVSMIVTFDDGRQVFAETTWRLLRAAYAVLSVSPIAAEENP